jgi:rod shape-determining protein MreD
MAYVGLLLCVVLDDAIRRVLPEGLLTRAVPSLPLITALYIGFRARDARPLGLAIVLGMFRDSFSSVPLGHFAFLYGATAYVALRLRRFVPVDHFRSHVAACFVTLLVTCLLALLIAAVTVQGPLGPGFLRSLVGAVTSAIAAPFVFAIWDRSRLFRSRLRGRSYEFAR